MTDLAAGGKILLLPIARSYNQPQWHALKHAERLVASMRAPRFSLLTLLFFLAVLPPLLAVAWYYWPARRVKRAIEDNPYEIIWDDYAPDVIPPKEP